MKLQVLQENLNKALGLASRFASVKAQLPVLGNILFSARKTKLTLSATNLETSISISLGAQIKEEGELTLPARVISDFVANLPATTLNLESEKEHLKITGSDFSSRVAGMNAVDFPAVPRNIDQGKSFVLPRENFLKALSCVSFSTSIDETRPILTGVLFVFETERLTLVATDGFRLSQKKIKLENSLKPQKVVLPKSALLELARIGEAGENLLFSFQEKENQILLGIENIILSSRILEGDFPPFEKIIPKSSNIRVRCDKEDLLRAVKLASVFARDSANIVRLNLKKGFLTLFAESSAAGSQETKVEAIIESPFTKTSENKGFEIAFNYRFLEDFLKAIEGEEVNLAFSDSISPGVFTDPQDPDYLHLIMPVKLQG